MPAASHVADPLPAASTARAEYLRAVTIGASTATTRRAYGAGGVDPALPSALEPPPLAPDGGLDGFRDEVGGDVRDCDLALAPWAPLLARAALAAWGPGASLLPRLALARWVGRRAGTAVDLDAAVRAGEGLAGDLRAAAAAPTAYAPPDFESPAAHAAWLEGEVAAAANAAAAAASAPAFAGVASVRILSWRAAPGRARAAARPWLACCAAPAVAGDAPPRVPARRIKAYVQVALRAGDGGGRAAAPSLRTPTARRGASAVWHEGAAVDGLPITDPTTYLDIALRDGGRRGALAAAVAADPVAGAATLALADVVARAGPAAGPVVWSLPVYAGEGGGPARSRSGINRALRGGTPTKNPAPGAGGTPVAAPPRTLVGVVRLEVDYVAESRRGSDGVGAAPAPPPPSDFPRLFAALAADWRAAARDGDDGGASKFGLPPPPPPENGDEGALALALPGGGPWLALARSAAAIMRARPETQAAAAVAACVAGWDAAAPAPDVAAGPAPVAAGLWARLAAAARSGDLAAPEATALRALAPRAAAAALDAVEAFGWRWTGPAGPAAAGATLRLLALATTWGESLAGLADPLAAHVRRGARRDARRAAAVLPPGAAVTADGLLSAATAALEAAEVAVAADAALRPAFGCGDGGLDPVAVAGRVRAGAALALLTAALAPAPDGTPPIYGADAQRAEDAARALAARLASAGAASACPGLSPTSVDALFSLAVEAALWRLRPLAVEWVDRTLAPRALAPSTFRPLSRAAGALYAPVVIDLYTLVSAAVDGLGARAVERPVGRDAAAAHARALAGALAPAPARAAALIEDGLMADLAKEAAAAPDAAGRRLPAWLRGGGRGSPPPPARGPPPPPSIEACTRLSSLFELVARHADNEAAQAGLRDFEGGRGRLAPNVELAARLAGAAARGARAVAARLDRALEVEFGVAVQEAAVEGGSGVPRRADECLAAPLIIADLEAMTERLTPVALGAVARAAWRRATSAAEARVVAAAAAPPAVAGALLAAVHEVAAALQALSGPAPLPASSLEGGLVRLTSLASLARGPTPALADEADALWEAAVSRGRRAWLEVSGAGREEEGKVEGDSDGDGDADAAAAAVGSWRMLPSWSRRSTADGAASRSPSPTRRRARPPRALPGLSHADAARLLRTRGVAGDMAAAAAATREAERAATSLMAAVFDVRGGDPVLLGPVACRSSSAGGARGALYLSSRHIAFARPGYGGPAAGGDDDVEAGAGAPVSLLPIQAVVAAERSRRRRSRALTLHAPGAPLVQLWEFGPPGRDAVEAALRARVAGDGSPLDRALRGLPPLGAPPSALADRAFEGRVGLPAAGAWAVLRATADGLALDSDECTSLACAYGDVVSVRSSRAAALAGGAGATITAAWAPAGEPPRPPGAPPRPATAVRLRLESGDAARELLAEVRARCGLAGGG
jgi:hypothetical protein